MNFQYKLARLCRPLVAAIALWSHPTGGQTATHSADPQNNPRSRDPWAQLTLILAKCTRPTLAPHEFIVSKFGAVADGKTDCTSAFRKAIAACAKAGGGRVVVPPGRYLTGPIHLTNNIQLHLTENAEIVFSDKPEAYLPPVFVRVGGVELYNYSPLIYARDCTNIAITGKGRLNGNGTNWWAWKGRETREFFEMAARGVPVERRVFGTPQAAIRPSFVCFISCTNVLLEGFGIVSGPNWTIHPVYCENVIIRGVTVATHGPNNDGIDIDSCRNVLIEHCVFDTGDDCVVLKSGYNEDGWRVGRPTENVVVRNCIFKRGHGGLVIGSEMSGDVRHVYAHDCIFEGTERAVRIKSARGRGGVVEHVYARNFAAKSVTRELVILNMDYSSGPGANASGKPPLYRNMCFENFTCAAGPTAMLIRGLPDSPVENIRFADFTVTSTGGVLISHATNLVFDRLQLDCAKSPLFQLSDAAGITIHNARVARDVDVFLRLVGTRVHNVIVEGCDLARVKMPLIVADGARPDAVVFR